MATNPGNPLRRRTQCTALLLALAAIGCQSETRTEPLRLVAIELGSGTDDAGRITTASRSFTPETVVHASIETAGSGDGTLRVVWAGPGGILSEEKRPVDVDGPTHTVFRFTPEGGWPTGRNRVGFALNDEQLRTAEFEVR